MVSTEKTKVCSIFEPTYRSIMTLPSEDMRLRMFVSLCDYAFDRIEPQFGSEIEERILAALWEQFRLVFIQAEKRARINSINGAKGGRPRKATVSNGFFCENRKKPTTTNTITGVDTAAADLYQEALEVEFEVDDNNNSVI